MKTSSKSVIKLGVALAGLVVFAAACGTTAGYKQADKTGAGIAKFRDEVVEGKKATDATMKSLSDIATTANTDPRKAYEKFASNFKKLESTAADIRSRAKSMQEKGKNYFKQWETELATVSDPEVRSLAEKRKAKLQSTFESIRTRAEPLKAQFDPWMASLRDLQTYLSHDLTIAGVDAAKDLFSKATKGGLQVQESMDALIAELNTVAATITPAKVEAKK